MSNKYPKISIVTPSYNQGRFIEDAIKSIIEQNYPNFEHIIIDNCSTDNTIEILKKYPHLVWLSEPDKGQSDAINKGFKKATGDIIGWLNADDYYLPEIFGKIATNLNKNSNIDIIYGNWNFVDKNKKILKKFQSIPFNYKILIYYGPYIGSTALFFRRSIIDEGHFINTKFKYVMDWEWFIRLASLGKNFIFINKSLACFRLHGVNQSMKYNKLEGINKLFIRAQQLAEGYAIKRFYGHHWGNDVFGGSLIEEISYRLLWWAYKSKVILLKTIYLLLNNNL
ncbi:MAG: glycosyltransferase family 2 protein [Candidatus Eremiobacterota bacterium]